MPLEKVGNCWRWGSTGKLYCGKGGKAKAAKQGKAIEASKKRRGK